MVFLKLRKLLADELSVDESEITMDTNIVNDLGADSLDVVELIAALEDEFDLIITDNTVRELYTVREVTEFIEKLINK